MPRKTDEEVKKDLEAELERRQEAAKKVADQLRDRLKAIDVRLDAKKRKIETRAKVLGGAFLFHHAAKDPKIRQWVAEQFPKFTDRPADAQLVVDFLASLDTPEKPPSAEPKPE